MDLETKQHEMQERSQEARKQARSQAQSGRKQTPRRRASIETILKGIAMDEDAPGAARVEACKLLLELGGRLPVKKSKEEDERRPSDEPTISGANLGTAIPIRS